MRRPLPRFVLLAAAVFGLPESRPRLAPFLVFEPASVIDGVSELRADAAVMVLRRQDRTVGATIPNPPCSAVTRNPFENINAVREVLLVPERRQIAVNALPF